MPTPLVSPLVGKILQAQKRAGDRVEEDEVVLLIEAMKMEIPVVAPASGILRRLNVSPGQAVEAGEVLGEIE